MTERMNLFDEVQIFDTRDLIELQCITSSKGNQRKWYDEEHCFYVKEQFFYQQKHWKDHLVEVIASEIGKQLPERCTDVLEQKTC